MQSKHGALLLLALFALFVLVVAACGDSPPAGDTGEAATVRQDVETMIKALYGGDLEKLLRYTHPKIIDLMGGPESAREQFGIAVKAVQRAGLKLVLFEITAEPTFLAGEENEFVIVPTRGVFDQPGGRIESVGFQMGARKKGETTWGYMEGSRLKQDSVREFFPDFPRDFEFPEIRRIPH